MTAYTLAANATLRDVGTAGIWGVATARTGGDTVDTNGFKLTIDQDSRYGFSGTTSTTWGSLTITSVVESLFAQTVADQIVSVASLNNLSVMDAIQSVAAKYSVAPLVVRDERKLRVEKPVRTHAPKQGKAPSTNGPMCSISDDIRITACAASETEFVVSKAQPLYVSAGENQIFIQHRPKRAALEQPSRGS